MTSMPGPSVRTPPRERSASVRPADVQGRPARARDIDRVVMHVEPADADLEPAGLEAQRGPRPQRTPAEGAGDDACHDP